MKLAKKGKVQLILSAARLGPQALIRQIRLVLMDSLVRKRHLVFRLDAGKYTSRQDTGLEKARLREILSADDILQGELAWLNDPATAHDWGAVAWLKQGWQLWMLEEKGQVLALAWLRNAPQSRDFFVPLDDNEELFWHVYVLPQHRGQNLQERIWAAIAHLRSTAGIAGFFTNCRDYNLPSRANIEKMGFQAVGHCDESRIMRRRVWRGY